MRNVVFIVGLLGLLSNIAYAQGVVEKKLAGKIAELNKKGIDTIMFYQFDGGIRTYNLLDTSTCYVYRNARYLIWIHQKHNFITCIDECYEYKVFIDKLNPIADFLTEHLSEIIQQDIRKPAFKTMRNGKEDISDLTVSDEIWVRYTFIVKEHAYVKGFGLSDLDTEYFEGNKNIYFDQNQKTYLKQIYDMMKSALPGIIFKKK